MPNAISAALAALLMPFKPERRAAASVLLHRGELLHTVYYLERGSVAFGVLARSNGEVTRLEHHIGQMQGPGWIDASAAMLQLPAAMDALAETDVLVRPVGLAAFHAALQDKPQLAEGLLLGVAQAHRMQTELAISRLAKNAESRCAEWLLQHMQISDNGLSFVHMQRKRQIAAQLGIAPETLSRVLRHLREARYFSGSGRTIVLTNIPGLRTLAQG